MTGRVDDWRRRVHDVVAAAVRGAPASVAEQGFRFLHPTPVVATIW